MPGKCPPCSAMAPASRAPTGAPRCPQDKAWRLPAGCLGASQGSSFIAGSSSHRALPRLLHHLRHHPGEPRGGARPLPPLGPCSDGISPGQCHLPAVGLGPISSALPGGGHSHPLNPVSLAANPRGTREDAPPPAGPRTGPSRSGLPGRCEHHSWAAQAPPSPPTEIHKSAFAASDQRGAARPLPPWTGLRTLSRGGREATGPQGGPSVSSTWAGTRPQACLAAAPALVTPRPRPSSYAGTGVDTEWGHFQRGPEGGCQAPTSPSWAVVGGVLRSLLWGRSGLSHAHTSLSVSPSGPWPHCPQPSTGHSLLLSCVQSCWGPGPRRGLLFTSHASLQQLRGGTSCHASVLKTPRPERGQPLRNGHHCAHGGPAPSTGAQRHQEQPLN